MFSTLKISQDQVFRWQIDLQLDGVLGKILSNEGEDLLYDFQGTYLADTDFS